MQLTIRVVWFAAGVALLAATWLPSAHGSELSDLYVYPANGQSQDQQEDDEEACYRYGRDQSGFDPMKAPTTTSPEPQEKGSVAGGAFKGALLGLAVGAAAGDAGEGAAIGAVGGGLFGGMRQQKSKEEQQQWADQQAATYQNNRSNYDRDFGACMEGRGYTVK